jgi:hypothetical protein
MVLGRRQLLLALADKEHKLFKLNSENAKISVELEPVLEYVDEA